MHFSDIIDRQLNKLVSLTLLIFQKVWQEIPLESKRLFVRVTLAGHMGKPVWADLGSSQWRGAFC
jgi:hypothetical protein